MSSENTAADSRLVRVFSAIERWGQALPDPLTLFAGMAALVVVLSMIFSGSEAEVVQRTGDVVQLSVKSLMSFEGIRWMLTSAVDNLAVTVENMSSANSQIRDTDVASESANFTKNQVLMQAGASMLAQANAVPHLALRLLG